MLQKREPATTLWPHLGFPFAWLVGIKYLRNVSYMVDLSPV